MNTTRALLVATSALTAAHGAAAAQVDVGQTPDDSVDEIIVTGVARPTSKLESTASVTSLPPDEIERTAPRSTAELFRALPGIQVEPSSGDANTNLKVRGLPISTGGSRYVAFQEDGFNTLLIGDIAFATADSLLRFDRSVDTVQAIRGSSSSTAAINAPGGIVNFISETGEDEEVQLAVTTGLNYEEVRSDFAVGRRFGDAWSGHVAGYYRTGEGVREFPDTAGDEDDVLEGGQVKATLYGEVDRLTLAVHAKYLDETVPTYLPIPAIYNGEGFDPAGTDFGDGTLFLGVTDLVNREDGRQAVDGDGFEAKMASLAAVADVELTDQVSLGLRARTADISGNFAAPFPANFFQLDGDDDDGLEGDGELAVEIVYFDTEIQDLSNDFVQGSVTGEFDFVTVQAGVEFASQTIDLNWHFNQYYRTLAGFEVANRSFDRDGDGDDDLASVGGVLYSNPAFGNCCTRSYDFDVDLISPFVSLSAEYGDFTFDASYRDFSYEVDGRFAEGAIVGPQDITRDGVIAQNELEVPRVGPARRADYEVDFDAWSVGANYQVTGDLAVFANYAEGGSVSSPDRITGNIREDGSIDNQDGFNAVEQFELGVKVQTGPASLFVTYFNAEATEAREFEVTRQVFVANTFEADGVEVEGTYALPGGFGVRGTATFTDAEITDSANADIIGNTPRRQADWVFNLSPYYEGEAMGRTFSVGANVFGTSETFVQNSNALEFDGYTVTSLFGYVDLTDRLRLQADVNNVFDTEGFTEGEEGAAVPGDLVRVRPINGRTATATLSLRF